MRRAVCPFFPTIPLVCTCAYYACITQDKTRFALLKSNPAFSVLPEFRRRSRKRKNIIGGEASEVFQTYRSKKKMIQLRTAIALLISKIIAKLTDRCNLKDYFVSWKPSYSVMSHSRRLDVKRHCLEATLCTHSRLPCSPRSVSRLAGLRDCKRNV